MINAKFKLYRPNVTIQNSNNYEITNLIVLSVFTDKTDKYGCIIATEYYKYFTETDFNAFKKAHKVGESVSIDLTSWMEVK